MAVVSSYPLSTTNPTSPVRHQPPRSWQDPGPIELASDNNLPTRSCSPSTARSPRWRPRARRSAREPSTGSCTTPTSARPAETASDCPSPQRQRSPAPGLTTRTADGHHWAEPMAITGPPGNSHDRHRAGPTTATGQELVALDTCGQPHHLSARLALRSTRRADDAALSVRSRPSLDVQSAPVTVGRARRAPSRRARGAARRRPSCARPRGQNRRGGQRRADPGRGTA